MRHRHPLSIGGLTIVLLSSLFACLCPSVVMGQLQADLQWVEVEVALAPNRSAMIQYKVHWQVGRGTMGGFYFAGEQGRIDWHKPGCGAVTPDGRKFQLDLQKAGHKWDVLLRVDSDLAQGSSRLY